MTAPVLDDVVQDALQRVVNSIHPLKVILFGSRARGDNRTDSDIDFLVVIADGSDRSELYRLSYRSMIGLGTPVDILLIDETRLERGRDDKYSVVFPALREGRVVYAA